MATFEVTPDELLELASEMSGLLGELSVAAGAISGGAGGAAQNGKLEGSIDSFVGDWVKGVDSLRKEMDQISARLRSAGGLYEAVENEISTHFGG